ncbi:MAG: hypothetical protein P9M03_01305 [Candidatus Theseobacter exili]|nr:hypothetical protein [Candidatus Theseobacter exili]
MSGIRAYIDGKLTARKMPVELLSGDIIWAEDLKLRFCEATLRNWEKKNLLIPHKFGTKKFYRLDEISCDLVR